MFVRVVLAALALAVAAPARGQEVGRVDPAPSGLTRLAVQVSGRVQPSADGGLLRQWPGTYFETAFTGPQAYVRIGAGEVSLRLSVDGRAPTSMVRPAPGLYRVGGLGPGLHRLRIDVASESQAGPTVFGGVFAGPDAASAALGHRPRQIEFIGDSHTVGYGNTSADRQCSDEQVWQRTDASRGLGPLTARRYDADYRVNAISGRGVVRNYDGFAADTLPQAYPYRLFDKAQAADDPDWRPQVIVIALGTNDFSTPLRPGERWKTREALHADFEATYVRFVGQLRLRNPDAYILLWATDLGGGEIEAEVGKVADRLRQAGDLRVGFAPVNGLAFTACNFHPSLADDRTIADVLAAHLDSRPGIWARSLSAGGAGADQRGETDMKNQMIAGGAAVLLVTGTAAQPAASAQAPAPAAPTAAPAAGDKLADRLINQPATATWSVYGAGQTNAVLPKGGPHGYGAVRVTVAAKGANPWDIGAGSPLIKPIAAGDTILVEVYLRAPALKDGEATTIPYFGVNQGAAPYDTIAQASAAVTNGWKLYYASGVAKKAYAADAVSVGMHLASDRHVLDLGPVRVLDLGPNFDPARLPKND